MTSPAYSQLGKSPYHGGKKLLIASAAVGALGLLITGIAAFRDPRQAGFSYLVAFAYWSGLAVAGLVLLQIFHASHARWPTVLRRPLEAMAIALVPLAILFLPIAVGARLLFPWMNPPADLPGDILERLRFSGWYLNPHFFFGRAGLYFAVWVLVAVRLHRWSIRQDTDPDTALTSRQQRLAAAALPAVGLTFTFAAYDWLMSPSLGFHSEILGLYWFGGSIAGVLSLLVLTGVLMSGPHSLGRHVQVDHYHSLGNLMLAFTAFWAWMAYSQGMLRWIANLPDEVPYLVARAKPGWIGLTAFLVVGQFALPFFALLSKELKRTPRLLAAVGVWILAVHYLDLYWVLMPNLRPESPAPCLTDLTALAGVGGVALAAAIAAMRGRHSMPVGDPYLEESLRYRP